MGKRVSHKMGWESEKYLQQSDRSFYKALEKMAKEALERHDQDFDAALDELRTMRANNEALFYERPMFPFRKRTVLRIERLGLADEVEKDPLSLRNIVTVGYDPAVRKRVNELIKEFKKGKSELPECRVCHHKHSSWFKDKDGIICDWCLNSIPCPGGEKEKDE